MPDKTVPTRPTSTANRQISITNTKKFEQIFFSGIFVAFSTQNNHLQNGNSLKEYSSVLHVLRFTLAAGYSTVRRVYVSDQTAPARVRRNQSIRQCSTGCRPRCNFILLDPCCRIERWGEVNGSSRGVDYQRRVSGLCWDHFGYLPMWRPLFCLPKAAPSAVQWGQKHGYAVRGMAPCCGRNVFCP